jgi:AcrR family transcriptional regulator
VTSKTATRSATFEELVAALATDQRPRSVLKWLRRDDSGASVLRQLGAEGLEPSHAVLETFVHMTVTRVRHMLVPVGALPPRHDPLERLPAWLDRRVAQRPSLGVWWPPRRITGRQMGAGAVTPNTRSRLLDTAVKLFSEHGVEGTSLQMIADELGIRKAAVYYHFKTKDAIAEEIVTPLLAELNPVVHEASLRRSRGAQIDGVLGGFVDLIVRHRAIVGLMIRDPGIMRAAGRTARAPTVSDLRATLNALLVGPEPTPTDMITAHVLVRGLALAGGDPEHAEVDDETLRRHLLDMGRRLLGRPRRRT